MSQLTLDGMVYYEPLLISLKRIWLDDIVAGRKKYEFRRSFFRDRSCAFVYVVSPHSFISHVLWLDKPIIAPPSEIARMADKMRLGGGKSVIKYMSGLNVGYAIPIIEVEPIRPISLSVIREHIPHFDPPQLYLRLSKHPQLHHLLMSCAKSVVDAYTFGPIR